MDDDDDQDFPKSTFVPGRMARDKTPDTQEPDSPTQESGPAPAPQPAPTPLDAERAHSLADHLERTGRHPVIIFGIGASGKTTMLMSLVQALNRSNEVNIYLGDPILPEEDSQAEQTHEQAITFFERDAQAFVLGEPVPPTRADNPYFIPVDVERKSDGRLVRLALMEGKGEWYAPIKGAKKGSMFQKFKQDLADVLEEYGESLSVIWIAPFAIGTGKTRDTRDSDLGLMGALTAYRKHRSAIAQDFHLFLINKWDCYAPPLEDKLEFSVVAADHVSGLISELYPNTWPKYEALALKTTGRRFFMQYAAGHIVSNRVKIPPRRHRAAFDRYPRTVWNWLYGNATQTEVGADGPRGRETLFLEVMPPPRERKNLLKWILDLVLAR